MSKVVSVRLPEELAEWVESYAKQRGVERTVLLESAIVAFKEDCDTGVPELRERIRRNRAAQQPKAGECSCPSWDDGVRGFSQKCPVHGNKTREEFNAATAARSELFRQLTPPESVRFGVEAAKAAKAKREREG